MFDITGKKIWIAGETGMVGQALLRALNQRDCTILSAPHSALDLKNQEKTYEWLHHNKPDAVIMAAAKVGGIGANMNAPADFLHDNLTMATNVIHGAYLAGVQKLLYLGSSCIYPRDSIQPIAEDALLTGALEKTNEGYALAKIAGLKLCQFYRTQYGCDYISAMPTNLYGPFDHFDTEKSHVVPAMILKFHEAKKRGDEKVILWGTGEPLREFLYVDDLAQALIHLLEKYSGDIAMNIGSGEEIKIIALAQKIKNIVGFDGEIIFDTSKPDGTPRKALDSQKIKDLGWSPKTPLDKGLGEAYDWFLHHFPHG